MKDFSHTRLADGGEFDIIRRMLTRWGARAGGIGDDAAVISSIGDRALVASTDSSVENVHFRRAWLSAFEIGYRATTAALSDLAAMAAKPLGMLVAMGIPDDWLPEIDDLADGIGDAAATGSAPILGGDISKATELSLTITVLGAARSPLMRSAAHPGDFVYVTGKLGGPHAALAAFLRGEKPSAEARARFARPVARIEEAAWLSDQGASAAIDISDGLASDLKHVAMASDVRIVVELDALPVLGSVSRSDAARSGEEYELAVTSPMPLDTSEFQKTFGLDLTAVGKVEKGKSEVVFMSSGKEIDVGRGYLHFR